MKSPELVEGSERAARPLSRSPPGEFCMDLHAKFGLICNPKRSWERDTMPAESRSLVFDLFQSKGPIKKAEFSDIVARLRTIEAWQLDIGADAVKWTTTSGMPGNLSLAHLDESGEDGAHPCLVLTIQVGDRESYQTVRSLLESLPLRDHWQIFSERHECYMPHAPDIIPAEVATWDERIPSILSHFEQVTAFATLSGIIFSKNEKGELLLVNPHLLSFALRTGTEGIAAGEFAYAVAPDVATFCTYYDFHAVPMDFYRFYRRPLRILNYSGFDIKNPGRKVFLRPHIYQRMKDRRFSLTKNEGALTYMDKIRKGETLEQSLCRILSQDLKIADDFCRAVVWNPIEFDLDREGNVTPRLQLDVLVEQFSDPAYAEQIKRTGWRSLDGRPPPKRG